MIKVMLKRVDYNSWCNYIIINSTNDFIYEFLLLNKEMIIYIYKVDIHM